MNVLYFFKIIRNFISGFSISELFLIRCLSKETPTHLDIGDLEKIKYFEVSGCEEEWCVLTERTKIPIKIKFIMRNCFLNN